MNWGHQGTEARRIVLALFPIVDFGDAAYQGTVEV